MRLGWDFLSVSFDSKKVHSVYFLGTNWVHVIQYVLFSTDKTLLSADIFLCRRGREGVFLGWQVRAAKFDGPGVSDSG